MEAFVVKTVKKLRKETPRKFQELRDICDELIAALGDEVLNPNPPENISDKYYEPFRLACDSRQSRLIEIGLEGIHYLIEHGYFRKSSSSSDDDSSKSVVDRSNMLEAVVELLGKCADDADDVVQVQVIKALLTAVTSNQCELHEGQLLVAVRSCFHIHLMSKNNVNKTTAKAALTQMLSAVNQRMERFEQSNGSANTAPTNQSTISSKLTKSPDDLNTESNEDVNANQSASDVPETAIFPSIYHKDAFLVFRALCKLSMKGTNDDVTTSTDAIALQNKILSLELIQHILQQCGSAFRNGEKFILAVRNILCVSLLSNCTSQNAQITTLSLQIFVLLMENFKDHLKTELEIFINGIFIRILESENSSFEQKIRVLEVFHSICRNSSAMVEIFINYDCDMDGVDLFRSIVDGYAKIAKHPNSNLSRAQSTVDFMSSLGKKAIQDELQVRSMGLEGLVIILQSMLKSAGLLDQRADDSGVSTSEKLREQTRSAQVKSNDSNEVDEDGELTMNNSNHSNNSVNVVDIFDRKQKIQEEIEMGILKFNLSPKKGLAYLAGLGHIEMNPTSVARFLLQYQERLDKTVVGDYLGKEREYENGFCLKVLHEYVDSMNFENLAFDLAIRQFLSGFRIPGEAQKIDRIMEKFAERYFLQNRDKFASADMAFILAFSTIMLQTNLHNPAIREDKRMTKEQFIKQNKGISADGEIPDDMLMEIYDRIAAQPITINQDDKSVKKVKKEENTSAFFQPSADRRRKDAFINERKEMVRAGEAMIKQMTRRPSLFRKKELSEDAYVRPMFDVVWAPILGVLSQVLEITDDQTIVSSCLHGFQNAIRLACRLDVPIARDTYINALAKFTTLDTVREMQPKNIECIKTLLLVALAEKEFIDESWNQVIQIVSQLARLQLFAAGAHTDEMFFTDNSNNGLNFFGSSGSGSSGTSSTHGSSTTIESARSRRNAASLNYTMDFTKFFTGPTRAEVARIVEESNAEMIMSEISPAVIDQIFLNSQQLSEQSVLHFVRSLTMVSAEEINISSAMNSVRNRESLPDATTPRVFCLQKLVEVADFNMKCRPRIAWQNMWKLLAEHFMTVGMSDNAPLAMYAVDSLKQLSIKFLQKEELSNFNFQRLFLKPFEVILSKSRSIEIKDLVLRCIDIMILACASNIRSGWRSIFCIFEYAAAQESLEVATIAFNIIERLMEKSFDLLLYDFVELMNCLVVFVSSRHSNLSLSALKYLSLCADKLAEGRFSEVLGHQNLSNDAMNISWEKSHRTNQVGEDAAVFRLWWPLLLGLSTQVSDSRPQVRQKALETLQSILFSYGHMFSPQAWSVIFKGVLFPIIDSAKTDFTEQPVSAFPSENPPPSTNKNSWIGTMGQPVLNFCQELFFKFRNKSDEARLLPELLTMLEGCICQDTEVLAKMGLRTFHELLMKIGLDGAPVSKDTLDLICRKLCSCLLNNFAVDFGEIGSLAYSPETPMHIRELFSVCPLFRRRKSKEDMSNRMGLLDEVEVTYTVYGEGRKIAIVPADERLGLPARHCVELNWARLYYPVSDDESLTLHQTCLRELSNSPWDQISVSMMTAMVVALESIRVVSDVISVYFNRLEVSQINEVLLALETLYWHARSFNGAKALRKALYDRGFMRFPDDSSRLPHLLEQEVFSLSKVLDIVVKLHTKCEIAELQLFAEPWFQRIVAMTADRYIQIERNLESSEESYDHEEHEAYGAAILIALHGLASMSEKQFSSFYPNISDSLSKMILCEDLDVRGCVSEIYNKQVNPSYIRMMQSLQKGA